MISSILLLPHGKGYFPFEQILTTPCRKQEADYTKSHSELDLIR